MLRKLGFPRESPLASFYFSYAEPREPVAGNDTRKTVSNPQPVATQPDALMVGSWQYCKQLGCIFTHLSNQCLWYSTTLGSLKLYFCLTPQGPFKLEPQEYLSWAVGI